mmetsp:Transcript_67467/g.133769  ORF Transcript_67467/g.133769 Transcript_67467/m.133769 type:complete len:117 (+) Transcript_67467:59-409(+)
MTLCHTCEPTRVDFLSARRACYCYSLSEPFLCAMFKSPTLVQALISVSPFSSPPWFETARLKSAASPCSSTVVVDVLHPLVDPVYALQVEVAVNTEDLTLLFLGNLALRCHPIAFI